ncbi:inverse autotransporter beta domain-containing protein [Novipirellula caenicola]|uniref:Inverse autotransporter beta-domain domain-containing protein n=1 Tax=Novipirellula caenicola TaxID=1536901 RepID=A0ABP9VWL2_9BACT
MCFLLTPCPHYRFASCLTILLFSLCGKSVSCAQSFSSRLGVHTQSLENGVAEGYSDLRAFIPRGTRESMFFIDGRLLHGHRSSDVGFNLGLGLRGYLDESDAIWGINLFTDQRGTPYAKYNQVGFGFEFLGSRLEVRNNYYFPFGDRRSILSTAPSSVAEAGERLFVFEQNYLQYGYIYNQQTQIEQSLCGMDLELGSRLRLMDGFIEGVAVSGYGGIYAFDNPELDDICGVSARLNAKFQDSFEVDVGVQTDNYFGTQATVGLTLYSDLLSKRSRRSPNAVESRMNDPVKRRSAMMIARGAIGAPPTFVGERLKNPDGTDIRVVHVDGTRARNGDGTFENPLNNVGDVHSSSQSGDIVYLYSDSVFDGQQTLTLQAGQRLLGEGDHYTHYIDTLQLGLIELPNVRGIDGARPVIMNSTHTAIRLANNTMLDNLSILDPFEDAGISGIDVVGARIVNTSITTNADDLYGLALGGASDVRMINSSITTSGYDAYGIFASDSSSVTMDQSLLTTTGGWAYGVVAQDTASLLFDNGSRITTSGRNGYGIAASGTTNIQFDNASSITTHGRLGTGIYATENAQILFDHASTITTNGLGGYGLHALGDTSIHFNNASLIRTHGVNSHAVTALERSTIYFDGGSTIHTTNEGGYGILLLHDAKATLDNACDILTEGRLAYGVRAQNNGKLWSERGSSVTTWGIDAYALRIEMDAQATIRNSSITSHQTDEILASSALTGRNMAIRIEGNTLDDGNGTIVLDNKKNAGLTVLGAANKSELAADNGITAGQITEIDTITYSP